MPKLNRPSGINVPLNERIELLSTKRQEIIRPILEHPRDFVLLSVRDLAKRLHSDPATIVRIVHGLGFDNYKQFRSHLHELSLAFATSLDTMQQITRVGGSGTSVHDSLFHDLKNLQGLKNAIDPHRFGSLAKRVYAARRVVILAGDLATVVAEYLGYQLNSLCLPIFVATSYGEITHTVRSVNHRDLVIAISFRRGLKQTVEGAEQARSREAYCVGIADTYLSPLARICNEVFLASTDSLSFGPSYTAPIALANAILTAVGEFRRDRTMEIVHALDEEQRKGSRWYTP